MVVHDIGNWLGFKVSLQKEELGDQMKQKQTF